MKGTQGLVLIFSIVTLLSTNTALGFYSGSSVLTHFIYVFNHAGVLHLILNCVAFYMFVRTLRIFISEEITLLGSYAIAVLASFFSEHNLPTVGCSGMIYAMAGFYLSAVLMWPGVKINNMKTLLISIFGIFISMFISSIDKSTNFNLHIISFVIGFFSIVPFLKFKNRHENV